MVDIDELKEKIMKVKEIIKKYHMPCSSIQDLYEREEILEMEDRIKRMEKDIEYLEYDKTEYSHNNGHYADENEYDEEYYYYDEFDHIHVIDD